MGREFAGYIDRFSPWAIVGWAADKNRPTTAVEVEIVHNDVVVDRILADGWRGDLQAIGIGSNHGFEYAPIVRRFWEIKVRIVGSTKYLEYSGPATSLDGEVEIIRGSFVSGWAIDYGKIDQPVAVEVVEDDQIVGEARADAIHPKQRSRLGGAGRVGFKIRTSDRLVHADSVGVRIQGTNIFLPKASSIQSSMKSVQSSARNAAIPNLKDVGESRHSRRRWTITSTKLGTNAAATRSVVEGNRVPIRADGSAQASHRFSDQLERAAKYLRHVGLFDTTYYAAQNPDVVDSKIDLFEHFFLFGFAEGRHPNPMFDPKWYIESHSEVQNSSLHPLLHYAEIGERDGLKPCPLFDPTWYREKYGVPGDANALAHYLSHRFGPFSPMPEFDADYYLKTYKDVAEAKVDPFEHYITYGYTEGRNPSAEFDTRFYIQRYFNGKVEKNPFLHYLEHRNEDGVYPSPPENEATIPSEVKRFTKQSAHFEDFRPIPPRTNRRALVLAYYLTQFHAFPENDRWWGTGFTEWTNVSRGLPRFKDHYQPRVPRDLGFYSLDNIEAMRRQVSFAKSSGVSGFVFYYYSFNQKRLMEKPLNQFLQAPDIDMPFCLMWANESWTRRWDGMESEVLISQDYRLDDDEGLLGDFARHFKDPRYIRLQGRPLLMIYRPGIIPDAVRVIERWRGVFSKSFGENPIIIMSQSFDDFDPRGFGLDGAIEFPPHKHTKFIPQINCDVKLLDDTFVGQVYSYDDMVRFSLEESPPPFPLIKTVVPSWDNDARRQGSGLVIHGSTPRKYEAWLSALVNRARSVPFFDEPIVCVNAWNEWCEGAYLEPDLHYGSAYLNATGRAVAGLARDGTRPRLCLVGHDAFPSGAQQLLLNIGRTLRSSFGVDIEFLLLAGGSLEGEYSAVAPVTIVTDASSIIKTIRDLCERGVAAAIVNTTAAGELAAGLMANGIHSVLLVHELPRLLREKKLEGSARAGIEGAAHVIFPAAFVRDRVTTALGIPPSDRFSIRAQGSYKKIVVDTAAAKALRKELRMGSGRKLVLGVGYADMRKGFDLFLQSWRMLQSAGEKVHFCWLGDIDPGLKEWLGPEIDEASATGTFHFVGYRSEVSAFFAVADVFALTSREDPFPTVALEALSIGLPVVAFDQSGGIPEFIKEEDFGSVVPHGDLPSFVLEIKRLLLKGLNRAKRAAARETIEKRFSFSHYVRDLMRLALPAVDSVSVAVPNYNYAHCLPERLRSIFDQSHPVEEILVLDDASSDNSVAVIREVATECQRDLNLVVNEQNSGSVFAQWAKAAEMTTGEFIWIAEADDFADPAFLARLVALMRTDATIGFGFCDSRAIDAQGAPLYASYKPYFASVEPDALTSTEVFEGADFARRFLSVKNLILNASSVLWRRQALLRALEACHSDLGRLRMAGDWRIYLECLAAPDAKVAYVADVLNVHRRHAASVTHALKAQQHVDEIRRMHALARDRFVLPNALLVRQAKYDEEIVRQLVGSQPRANVEASRSKFKSRRRAARQ